MYHVVCAVYGKAPTRQLYIVCPLLSLEVATAQNKSIHPTLSSIRNKVRLKSGVSRMQLTLHATRLTAHGASRLVQAISAWSVKTLRAPSRHCRDARVYGHTTTAMHVTSTTPSPHLSPHGCHPSCCCCCSRLYDNRQKSSPSSQDRLQQF